MTTAPLDVEAPTQIQEVRHFSSFLCPKICKSAMKETARRSSHEIDGRLSTLRFDQKVSSESLMNGMLITRPLYLITDTSVLLCKARPSLPAIVILGGQTGHYISLFAHLPTPS